MKKRTISLVTVLTLIIYVVINLISISNIYAAQYSETYNANTISRYPGYKALIDAMKAAHPNWNFTIFYTGLDWNQVIKNETTAAHGRNVVPASKSSSWKCSTCGETPRGGSSWRCASEAAVSYYMDPRNWINDSYIFQFETLSFNGDIQTLAGVQKIISNINYMQGSTVTYTKTDGTQGTLNKSYAQIILDAAREANISPYHLAARLKQEQGGGNKPGATATGTYPGYVGYYNFMNIGATGDNDSEVIRNGLQYAKDKGWTDPEKSIKAGAAKLATSYIGLGQDTLYLQKFDVSDKDGALYWHQYMQNVSVCLTEGASVRSTYESLGLLNSPIDFKIPVFENMPTDICPIPKDTNIVTQNVKIKGTSVNIRSGAGASYSVIASVNTGYDLLRIELARTTVGGHYWDKVVLPNGTKGYVARQYLTAVADITNCHDTLIVSGSGVNLRNGPGTSGTTVITTLTKGQVVTRIEKDKYRNLDGNDWDRIKLSDGTQGYIASKYLSASGTSNPNTGSSSSSTELIRVICRSGLKVREQPGVNQKVLTYVDKGDVLTRVQANVSNVNGYIWDKVVTSTGVEGYIARGDSTETYIEVIQSGNTNTGTTTPTVPTQPNNNIKIENDNLVCEPATTVESIKEKYTDAQVSVKDSKGNNVTTGNVGTGYKITINDKEYTVIKLGDANGDGESDAIDLLLIKRSILGKYTLNDNNKKSLDLNKDKVVDAIDLLLQKKHILGTKLINI